MLYLAQPKAAAASINYSFDWTDWLSSGTTVTGSAWTADAGLTVNAAGTIVSPRTTTPVSGGTAGTSYRAHNTATASNGEIDTRSVLIVVDPAAATGPSMQADLLLFRLCKLVPFSPATEPIPEVYEQAVHDAVAQLSQDAPLMRTATLNIVAGTATYSLPTDFQTMIALTGLNGMGGVIIGDNGLIPYSTGFSERYDIAGNQITFTPTPTYTMTRTLRYAARHVLADGAYANLGLNGARIALLYAQSLVLSHQASQSAGSGWKYQIGDEMVDKSQLGKGLMGQSEGLLKQYQTAVAKLKGYGQRAEYDLTELASWA